MKKILNISDSNLNDLRFGLQTMGDYARFILEALSPNEKLEIESAQKFITLFDDLLKFSRNNLSKEQINLLNPRAFQELQKFRNYILQILRQQISNKIIIFLSPPSLNMMINTIELLLKGLSEYTQNMLPDISTLSSTWLRNIYVHLLIIQNNIGIMYFEERAKAGELAHITLNLFHKSLILDDFNKTGIKDYPALKQFNEQINKHMTSVAEYLVGLMDLIVDKKYIGMLTLLFIDNLYRRVCFYMTKLSIIFDIPVPACDPASPRRE